SSSSYSAGDAISLDSGATVVLDHVLIVGSGAAGDCDIATSSVTDVGGSVETGTTCLGASPTGPDSTSGVPRVEVSLGTFADHGGPTWTYSLSDGSIAIDISDGPCTVATDQRGRTRPAGPGCDAGAYEAPFVVTPAYNGPWWINSSGAVANLSVAATISPPAAGCTLVFEFSGGIWTTSGATSETTSFTTSGTSRSDGTATAPLSNVRLGIYDVTVTVSGACSATEAATGTLAVLPGTVPKGAVGGGSYRLSDTGGWAKNSFGSIVSLSSSYNKRTGVTTTTTRGQIVWSSDADNSQGSSGWRLKDAFIRSTTDGSSIWQPFVCPNTVGSASPNSNPKCGRFTRTALLEERTVAGGWVPSGYGTSGLVTYTVTVYDGGSLTTCQRKQCRTTELADWFGLTIVGVPAPTSAADPVPQVGVPARLRIGSARVF
ncbi:MAG: hypothetical protein RL338_1383, partial [Chloroflexota bacterium]